MICKATNPAQRRLFARFAVAMLAYMLFLVPVIWGFVHYRQPVHWPTPWRCSRRCLFSGCWW